MSGVIFRGGVDTSRGRVRRPAPSFPAFFLLYSGQGGFSLLHHGVYSLSNAFKAAGAALHRVTTRSIVTSEIFLRNNEKQFRRPFGIAHAKSLGGILKGTLLKGFP